MVVFGWSMSTLNSIASLEKYKHFPLMTGIPPRNNTVKNYCQKPDSFFYSNSTLKCKNSWTSVILIDCFVNLTDTIILRRNVAGT